MLKPPVWKQGQDEWGEVTDYQKQWGGCAFGIANRYHVKPATAHNSMFLLQKISHCPYYHTQITLPSLA